MLVGRLNLLLPWWLPEIQQASLCLGLHVLMRNMHACMRTSRYVQIWHESKAQASCTVSTTTYAHDGVAKQINLSAQPGTCKT